MVQSRIVHKTALFLLLFVFPHQLVHGKISLKVISNDIYIYIYIYIMEEQYKDRNNSNRNGKTVKERRRRRRKKRSGQTQG
jgi:hypothetical protein